MKLPAFDTQQDNGGIRLVVRHDLEHGRAHQAQGIVFNVVQGKHGQVPSQPLYCATLRPHTVGHQCRATEGDLQSGKPPNTLTN